MRREISKKEKIKERDEFFNNLDEMVDTIKEEYKEGFKGTFFLINIPERKENTLENWEKNGQIRGQISHRVCCNVQTLQLMIEVLENQKERILHENPEFLLLKMLKKMKENWEEDEDELKW